MILMEKKFLELFTKKNSRKQIKKSLKVIKEKDNKLYAKLKRYNNLLNRIDMIKKTVQMSEYFPKPKSLRANVKVELNLSIVQQN